MQLQLIGKKFGKLVVISCSETKNREGRTQMLCKCDCGNHTNVLGCNLKSGKTKSCGCIKKALKKERPNWKGYGEISGIFFHRIQSQAIERNFPFTLTIEQIWDLFLKQKGKCALSGINIKFQSRAKKSDGTASLDRIDSSKGYEPDNIQWVHKRVNIMKQNISDKELINWCDVISQYHKK